MPGTRLIKPQQLLYERCRVQISHIGSMGGYGQMKQLLQDVEGYAASGTDIMCDCYPYNAFSTMIGSTTYDPENYAEYNAPYSAILMSTGKYAGQRCTKEIYDWERANAPDATASDVSCARPSASM